MTEVEATADELRLVNRPPAVTSRHAQEFVLFLILTIVRRAVGRAVPLVRLELMSSEPTNSKPLAQAFGCAITLDRVARALGMSGRTLQRDLRDAGNVFRDLADEVRRDVAISHVKHGPLPITAIALLLDFSEVSAFHRSFRRWTGQAPSAFRTAASRS